MTGHEHSREATPVELDALGSAVRLRIIRLTHHRPLTNKEIADRLGRDPATTLHHVRKLVDAGFLEAMPARRGTRGAREIPYRSVGRSWAFGIGDSLALREAMLQAFLAEVADVGMDDLRQSRLVVQVPEADRDEFVDRLEGLLDEYASRPVEPDAPRTAVYLAFYPSA